MNLIWLAIIAAGIGLAPFVFLMFKLKRQKIQDETAGAIARHISKGAKFFFWQECRNLAIIVILIAGILFILPVFSRALAVAFLAGAIFSASAGFLAMHLATLSNVRVAEKSRDDFNAGLRLLFSSGSAIGLTIASLGLLGVALLYLIFGDLQIIFGFGFGASLVALFARVGGGIYTKAADIGADAVGKLEFDLAEDDSRNPAAIADNVGDNVGDIAGMGADLFESYVDAIMAAMIFGLLLLPFFGSQAVVLPLLLAGAGVILAVLKNFSFEFLKGQAQKIAGLDAWLSALILAVVSFFIIQFTVGEIKVFWALLVGLVAGAVIHWCAKHFVSARSGSVRKIAKAAEAGAANNVIAGLAFGFSSVIIPALIMILTIYFANRFAGLYGMAIATMGLVVNWGILLAGNAYGPIADNAAGIAKMAGMESEVHDKISALDTAGNTEATLGKNFAINSATLTAIALLFVLIQFLNLSTIDLMAFRTIAGLLLGGVVAFGFVALTIKAVVNASGQMATEVRRQFNEIPGLASGETNPHYKRCLNIAVKAALNQMILPGLLILLAPIAVGLGLGALALVGFLAGAIVVGFLLAVFMINAGGALDNAKKYLESDGSGEKEKAYRAAVVGDMVGDPLKDVAGPALNILIKLMVIISIVIAPLLV